MKKILFVVFTDNYSWGVAILASLAQRHGWQADILFLPRDNTVDRFTTYAANYRPDLVAISFMSYDRRLAFEVAKSSKEMGVRVIAGGIHPTFLPEDVALTGLFDVIVSGDGMGILGDVLNNIPQAGPPLGQIVQGKRHPKRRLYTDLFYSASQIERMRQTRSAMLLSSQGCPFKCRFCASGALDYISYRPDEIVGLIDRLHAKYGVVNFQFFDDLFVHSAERCQAIHRAITTHFGGAAPIRYGNFVQARASTFNEAIASELVHMGVGCVNFGIETASSRLLKFLNKKQTAEHCYKAMRICEEHGLVRKVNLMFGLPTQDLQDYEATLRFVEETRPEIITSFFFVPMPGSDLYDYCFNHGYLPRHLDRRRFDWFEDRPDGFVEIQYRLQHIDYDMALDYKKRIEKSHEQVEFLYQRARLIDHRPWVILGTSKAYYFKCFIERLSSIPLENCLGYIDVEEDGGFRVSPFVQIKKYDSNHPGRPDLCVTYCYRGGDDFEFIHRAARERFGDAPLVSLASYKYHSLQEIQQVIGAAASRTNQ